jgi:hypothetical protein
VAQRIRDTIGLYCQLQTLARSFMFSDCCLCSRGMCETSGENFLCLVRGTVMAQPRTLLADHAVDINQVIYQHRRDKERSG